MRHQDTFRNSKLDRAKPKRHLFYSLLKRHHSDTGLVEDRTSSVTIVRIIVGLLMLHLIIIGGVLLRGHMVRGGSDMIPQSDNFPVNVPKPAQTAHAASPATPAAPASATPLSPLAPTAPAVASTAAHRTAGSRHITQSASSMDDEQAEDAEAEEVQVTPVATATPVRHLVGRGDSWQSIAQQYGVSANALQAANPGSSATLPAVGSILVVPTGASSAATAATRPQSGAVPTHASASSSAAVSPAAVGGKVYTVQRGETLSRISRKVHVPVKELMQMNGIKDANRIKPGMQLRLK